MPVTLSTLCLAAVFLSNIPGNVGRDIPRKSFLSRRAIDGTRGSKYFDPRDEGAFDSFGSDGGRYNPYELKTDLTDIRRNVPGEPGVDYPAYTALPQTEFTCQGRARGYYADEEAGCQLFHVCHDILVSSFLCPIGSTFSQKLLTCDWWNKVDCSSTGRWIEERKTDYNQQDDDELIRKAYAMINLQTDGDIGTDALVDPERGSRFFNYAPPVDRTENNLPTSFEERIEDYPSVPNYQSDYNDYSSQDYRENYNERIYSRDFQTERSTYVDSPIIRIQKIGSGRYKNRVRNNNRNIYRRPYEEYGNEFQPSYAPTVPTVTTTTRRFYSPTVPTTYRPSTPGYSTHDQTIQGSRNFFTHRQEPINVVTQPTPAYKSIAFPENPLRNTTSSISNSRVIHEEYFNMQKSNENNYGSEKISDYDEDELIETRESIGLGRASQEAGGRIGVQNTATNEKSFRQQEQQNDRFIEQTTVANFENQEQASTFGLRTTPLIRSRYTLKNDSDIREPVGSTTPRYDRNEVHLNFNANPNSDVPELSIYLEPPKAIESDFHVNFEPLTTPETTLSFDLLPTENYSAEAVTETPNIETTVAHPTTVEEPRKFDFSYENHGLDIPKPLEELSAPKLSDLPLIFSWLTSPLMTRYEINSPSKEIVPPFEDYNDKSFESVTIAHNATHSSELSEQKFSYTPENQDLPSFTEKIDFISTTEPTFVKNINLNENANESERNFFPVITGTTPSSYTIGTSNANRENFKQNVNSQNARHRIEEIVTQRSMTVSVSVSKNNDEKSTEFPTINSSPEVTGPIENNSPYQISLTIDDNKSFTQNNPIPLHENQNSTRNFEAQHFEVPTKKHIASNPANETNFGSEFNYQASGTISPLNYFEFRNELAKADRVPRPFSLNDPRNAEFKNLANTETATIKSNRSTINFGSKDTPSSILNKNTTSRTETEPLERDEILKQLSENFGKPRIVTDRRLAFDLPNVQRAIDFETGFSLETETSSVNTNTEKIDEKIISDEFREDDKSSNDTRTTKTVVETELVPSLSFSFDTDEGREKYAEAVLGGLLNEQLRRNGTSTPRKFVDRVSDEDSSTSE